MDAYTVTRTRYRGKPVENFTEYTYDELKTDENGVPVEDENGEKVWVTHTGVPYKLVRHNLKSGAEDFSLNKGTGGPGIYLYYATASQDVCFGKDSSTLLKPIKNIAFAYGDLSPKYASEAQLAEVYQPTFHGQIIFEATPYETMSWENVLAFRGDSAEGYNPDGRNCFTAGLNYGTLPIYGNDVQHTGNKQVRMYVDRGGDYTPRTAYALSDEGYYSTTTKYGTLAIK